jgi:hypothetical protein
LVYRLDSNLDKIKSSFIKPVSVSKESEKEPVLYSDWLTLLGFLGESEALQYIQGQGIPLITEPEEWLQKIRTARETVSRISGRTKLQPQIKKLGAEYEPRLSQLKAEPTFHEHLIGMKSSSFAWVELAKIHSFQMSLNVEYVNTLIEKAPAPSDLENTVKFCLPTRDEVTKTPVLSSFNPTTNTFTIVTQNLDLRIAGNVQGEDPNTHRPIAGFVYSFGLPQMSVVEYRGFYIMKNGYHRAYALLKKGHKFIPCLLLSTDAYQSTGGQQPGFLPIDLVISDKSPVLSDFRTPAAVLVPRRRLRMMISIHAEQQVIPM